MSEAELQKAVLELAKRLGWRTSHFTHAQVRPGQFVTPTQGDGVGFPDLTMVRGGRLLFAELKSKRGVLRAEQRQWLAELANVAEIYVWKPADWDSGHIEDVLR